MGAWQVFGASVVAWMLCGCGGKTTSDLSPDGSAPAPPNAEQTPLAPPVGPRWVAITTVDSPTSPASNLCVVRFDDVEQPQVIRLATGSDGEQFRRVYWSPTGEHVAFVTVDDAGASSLWVASVTDGFARRQVTGLSEITPANEPNWQPGSYSRSLSWMGPDTLLLATPSEDRLGFYRIPVATLLPELLGEYPAETDYSRVPFDASRFGVLFAAGTAEQIDLWFAGESGEPRRLGGALSADIAWAPDGKSANWWIPRAPTTLPPDEDPFAGGLSPEPIVEIVPDQLPRIGYVNFVAGQATQTYALGGSAFAPEGSRIAFSTSVSEAGRSGTGYIVLADPVASTFSIIDGGGGLGYAQSFGFLDRDTFFFPQLVKPDPLDETSWQLVVRRAGLDRTIGTARAVPEYFDGFANTDRLFFVVTGIDERTLLWTIDLSDPDGQAEQVPIDGVIVGESVLKQGQALRGPPGIPTGDGLGQALLLASSDDTQCRRLTLSDPCQTARWVVDLRDAVQLVQLDERWVIARRLSWAVDGTGLLALGEKGLSFIPGPSYRGSFLLSADAVDMISPDHWPIE